MRWRYCGLLGIVLWLLVTGGSASWGASATYLRQMQQAMNLVAQQQYADAIPRLQELIQHYPDNPDVESVLAALGQCYLSQQRWADAIQVLTTLTGQHPQSRYIPEATVNLYTAHLSLRHDADAETYYRQVMTRWPKTDYALLVLETDIRLRLMDDPIGVYTHLVHAQRDGAIHPAAVVRWTALQHKVEQAITVALEACLARSITSLRNAGTLAELDAALIVVEAEYRPLLQSWHPDRARQLYDAALEALLRLHADDVRVSAATRAYLDMVHQTRPDLLVPEVDYSVQQVQAVFDRQCQQLVTRDAPAEAYRPVVTMYLTQLGYALLHLAGVEDARLRIGERYTAILRDPRLPRAVVLAVYGQCAHRLACQPALPPADAARWDVEAEQALATLFDEYPGGEAQQTAIAGLWAIAQTTHRTTAFVACAQRVERAVMPVDSFAWLAEGYLRQQTPAASATAVTLLDDLLQRAPQHPDVPRWRYLRAQTLEHQGRTPEARSAYQQLRDQETTSRWAQVAAEALARLSGGTP